MPINRIAPPLRLVQPWTIVILLLFLADFTPAGAQDVEISSPAANIRTSPSTASAVLVRAERGTRFEIVSRTGEWYQISLPGDLNLGTDRGYVHRSTVTEIDNVRIIRPEDVAQEPAGRQERPERDVYEPSPEIDVFENQRRWSDRQWREYERYEKSEFAAAGLEWIIPMLGYAYVDKATAGLTPALVSLGGLTVMFFGAYTGDTGNAALVWGGFVGYVGGRIWGIVNALEYADSYNRELIRRISYLNEAGYDVVLAPGEDGTWQLAVRLSR